MDVYVIKINGQYFVGISGEEVGGAPVSGWYDEGGSICCIELSREREKAKVIEGNINLMSYFNKIYNAVRYGTFKFDNLEIVRVSE